jgi:hypothetical protein
MASETRSEPRFECGLLFMTRSVEYLVNQGQLDLQKYLGRHVAGDWGDVSESDSKANDAALHHEGHLFSCYQVAPTLKLWIITEGDRSVTTLLRT